MNWDVRCLWFPLCGNMADGALVLAPMRLVPCCDDCERLIGNGKPHWQEEPT